MKATRITHGWQCRVYVYPNHVIKTRRPYKKARAAVKKWLHMEDFTGQAIRRRTLKIYSNLTKAKKAVEDSGVPRRILGDLKFLKHGRMWQRRAVPLRVRFANLSKKKDTQAIKELIDQYIDINHELWRYGVFESIFNFGRNNGVIKDRVIFLDPFEQIYVKSSIEKRLRKKPWERWIEKADIPPSAQKYFKRICNQEFSVQKFRSIWRRRLN